MATDFRPGVGPSWALESAQVDAAMRANQKARQEMQDFYAAREALSGAGDELPYGAPPEYKRSNALRKLYAVNPQAAIKYENELLAPDIAARRAGDIEKAKIAAEIAGYPAFFAAMEGQPAPAAAPAVGPAPKVRIDPSYYGESVTREDAETPDRPETPGAPAPTALPSAAMPASRAPSLVTAPAPAADLPDVERTMGIRAGKPFYEKKALSPAERAQKSSELELKQATGTREAARAKEVTTSEQRAQLTALEDRRAVIQGKVNAGDLKPEEGAALLGKIDSMENEILGRKAEAPAAPASSAAAAPPALPYKRQLEEQIKIAGEQRQQAAAKEVARHEEYREFYKPGFVPQTDRAAAAANVLPRLLQLQNENQYGDSLLNLPFTERLKIMSQAEANEFNQGFKQLGQGAVQPGTSGSMNTTTELQNYLDSIGGLKSTARMNTSTLVGRMNVLKRNAVRSEFFQILEEKGLPLAKANSEWNKYMEASPPYITQEVGGPGEKKRYLGVKNPNFQTPAEYLAKKPAGKAAPAAASKPTRTIGTKTYIEERPGDWVEQ